MAPATTTTTNNANNRRRVKPKSTISQIHEAALRLKACVEFEVVRESGEPHQRRFVVEARFSFVNAADALVASRVALRESGDGASKKEAKVDACKKILERLRELRVLSNNGILLSYNCNRLH